MLALSQPRRNAAQPGMFCVCVFVCVSCVLCVYVSVWLIHKSMFGCDHSDYTLRLLPGLAVDAEKFGNEARYINDFRCASSVQCCVVYALLCMRCAVLCSVLCMRCAVLCSVLCMRCAVLCFVLCCVVLCVVLCCAVRVCVCTRELVSLYRVCPPPM